MVIKKLPMNDYNVAQTMRDVGYSSASARSGAQYAILRKKIEKAYNPEQIKKDILKAEKDFAKDKDNSNRARMLELRARVQGLGKDSTATQVNVNINDTIAKLKAKTIDVTPDNV
jgi:hypothetical protein